MSSTRTYARGHCGQIDAAVAQAVVAGLDAAVLLVDAHNLIVYRNATADEVLSVADTLPETFADLRILGPFDGWESTLDRVRNRRERVRVLGTKTIKGAVDSPPFTVRCLPVDARVGGEPGAVLIVVDADGFSSAHSNPTAVARHLSTLDGLAARVAHELNNPLDAVLRYLNLALQTPKAGAEPKLRDYLKQSQTGAVRMMRIVSDMLSRVRGASLKRDKSRVDEIIQETLEVHAGAAHRAGIVIDINHDSDNATVEQGHRLYHVVSNLIGNAIEAMMNGGRLTISTYAEGTDLVVTVADTGVGLPVDLQRLFEPFYTTKQPHEGTGLGLAICKELVDEQGGAIEAMPGKEGGAVFIVRWPRGDRHPTTQTSEA